MKMGFEGLKKWKIWVLKLRNCGRRLDKIMVTKK
jgi:hypothetical protein